VLPLAIASVRRFVRHPIGTIHVVGAAGVGGAREAARGVALSAGCTFHEEACALGDLATFEVEAGGANRSAYYGICDRMALPVFANYSILTVLEIEDSLY
jgi:hypothetical protein